MAYNQKNTGSKPIRINLYEGETKNGNLVLKGFQNNGKGQNYCLDIYPAKADAKGNYTHVAYLTKKKAKSRESNLLPL